MFKLGYSRMNMEKIDYIYEDSILIVIEQEPKKRFLKQVCSCLVS